MKKELLDFGQALDAIRAGCKVKRTCWGRSISLENLRHAVIDDVDLLAWDWVIV